MIRVLSYSAFLVCLSLLCWGCAEEALPDERVYEVRNIGQLSTTEYTVGKIISLNDEFNEEDSEWYEYYKKYGERKILISCRAKVKAGIDLTELKEGDIVIEGSTIEITLPPAKITTFSMDPSDIRTEMESITGLRSEFSQEEKNSFLKQGEEAIRKDLASTGILKDANENAAAFLKEFYGQMGYKNVIVHTSKEND